MLGVFFSSSSYSEVTNVINKHAPIRTVKVKGRHLPWISSDLIKLFKQRDKAWAKYWLSWDSTDWENYRCLRNLCKAKTKIAKANYFERSSFSGFS